jgi:hypothetical protein
MILPPFKETLDKYHVADKLGQLRRPRKMGLLDLRRHSGLFPAATCEAGTPQTPPHRACAFARGAGF